MKINILKLNLNKIFINDMFSKQPAPINSEDSKVGLGSVEDVDPALQHPVRQVAVLALQSLEQGAVEFLVANVEGVLHSFFLWLDGIFVVVTGGLDG